MLQVQQTTTRAVELARCCAAAYNFASSSQRHARRRA
jgi:hypothetical protein